MSFINLQADLTRTADALERIAHCLERLLPPIYPETQPKEPAKIETVNNETTYEYELEDQLQWWKDKQEMIMREYGDGS